MTNPQAPVEDLLLASPNPGMCLSLNAIIPQQMHTSQVHRLLLNEIIKPLCSKELSKAPWWKMASDWSLGLIIQFLLLESFKDAVLLSLLPRLIYSQLQVSGMPCVSDIVMNYHNGHRATKCHRVVPQVPHRGELQWTVPRSPAAQSLIPCASAEWVDGCESSLCIVT